MLTHYAIFLWFLGEKDGFKTDSSLSEGGLRVAFHIVDLDPKFVFHIDISFG
jgi:hypothetical protein